MSSTFVDYFASVANSYRRFRPSYPPALFKFLSENAPSNAVALDIGAGNGQAAAGLAHYFESVFAIDTSEEQLANALPTAGVYFHQATAEDTGVKDACADLVIVAQALHWFDQPAFFKEAERILKPGGLLAIVTYGRMSISSPIDAILSEYYDEIIAPFWPEERHMVENAYADIEFPFNEVPTPDFPMRSKWTLDEVHGYLETWSASRRYRDAHGHFATEKIRPRLTETWGEDTRREITWPLTVFVRRKPA